MSRSVHDNFITGYEVDCESTTIAIHTEHRDHGQPFERTDVFEGVVGYFFRDNLTGILFAIEDSTIDEILVEYAKLHNVQTTVGTMVETWRSSKTLVLNNDRL